MIIEHTGMVVYGAVSDQKVFSSSMLLFASAPHQAMSLVSVHVCVFVQPRHLVLIERMTLLNESKESRGQDLFMLELL